MKKLIIIDGVYPEKEIVNNGEIIKQGWGIKKEGNKFLLTYISGELSGEARTVEISEKDFNLAKDDKLSLDELARIYNFS